LVIPGLRDSNPGSERGLRGSVAECVIIKKVVCK